MTTCHSKNTESQVPGSLTGATYEIGSLADFAKVPQNRLAACLVEFAAWVEIDREIQQAFPGTVSDFIWTDDGECRAEQVVEISANALELSDEANTNKPTI